MDRLKCGLLPVDFCRWVHFISLNINLFKGHRGKVIVPPSNSKEYYIEANEIKAPTQGVHMTVCANGGGVSVNLYLNKWITSSVSSAQCF